MCDVPSEAACSTEVQIAMELALGLTLFGVLGKSTTPTCRWAKCCRLARHSLGAKRDEIFFCPGTPTMLLKPTAALGVQRQLPAGCQHLLRSSRRPWQGWQGTCRKACSSVVDVAGTPLAHDGERRVGDPSSWDRLPCPLAQGPELVLVHGPEVLHTNMRKAMVDPGKNWSSYITLIDLSTELLGLSTLWLGAEFYRLDLSRISAAGAP